LTVGFAIYRDNFLALVAIAATAMVPIKLLTSGQQNPWLFLVGVVIAVILQPAMTIALR